MDYDNIDAMWGWSGDYSIKDGDLEDTMEDFLISLFQDIHTVAASSLQDWEEYPRLGATLDDFLGEPNNPTTASAISNRLKVSLISAGIVQEGDLAIKVVPVHNNKVFIVVGISAASTAYNSLPEGQKLITSLIFDTAEQNVYFLDVAPQLIPNS